MLQTSLEGSNKILYSPGDSTETEPDLPLSVWGSPVEVCVSNCLPQGQELWVQQTWVWHKPPWRRLPLTPHRAGRTYTGLGKQTFGRHKQNLVCTRNQEKGALTPQDTDSDLSVSPGVFGGSMGRGGLVQGQGHWGQQCLPFKGGHH